jgi:hypothetical protein
MACASIVGGKTPNNGLAVAEHRQRQKNSFVSPVGIDSKIEESF